MGQCPLAVPWRRFIVIQHISISQVQGNFKQGNQILCDSSALKEKIMAKKRKFVYFFTSLLLDGMMRVCYNL